MVFDLLAVDGYDLRREPLRVRRQRLEQALTDVDPPLVVSPATKDREQAQEWLAKYAAAHVGIEGIVAKGLAQPYRGGARDWLKYRYRDTVDVIVGAVTGTLPRPERLILGLYHDELGAGVVVVAGVEPGTDLSQLHTRVGHDSAVSVGTICSVAMRSSRSPNRKVRSTVPPGKLPSRWVCTS